MDKGNILFPEATWGIPEQVIRAVKDHDLTIITNRGDVLREKLFIKARAGKVSVDKPSEWNDNSSSLHLFFRNNRGCWSFFKAPSIVTHKSSLSLPMPDTIYTLQNRRYPRIPAPMGTEAIFRNQKNRVDTVFVKNISEGGMLICTGFKEDRLRLNSFIDDIFITVPSTNLGRASLETHRVLPLISRGQVIRNFTEPSSALSYYGLSFLHDSSYLRQQLHELLTNLQNMN